jgi:hypothetical protein
MLAMVFAFSFCKSVNIDSVMITQISAVPQDLHWVQHRKCTDDLARTICVLSENQKARKGVGADKFRTQLLHSRTTKRTNRNLLSLMSSRLVKKESQIARLQ